MRVSAVTGLLRQDPPAELGPSDGTVDVFEATVPPRGLILRLHEVLNEHERARATAFRHADDAARFVAGRALIRLALARATGIRAAELVFDTWCTTCGSPHGRPRLVNDGAPHVEFSLSRSAAHLLAAVAMGAVGVDIEIANRDIDFEAISGALADNERDEVRALPASARRRALLRCWTRKEAVLKALGHGLAIDPSSISVSLTSAHSGVIRAGPSELGDPQRWSLRSLEGETAVAAVAVRGPIAELRFWNGEALFADVVAGERQLAFRRKGAESSW